MERTEAALIRKKMRPGNSGLLFREASKGKWSACQLQKSLGLLVSIRGTQQIMSSCTFIQYKKNKAVPQLTEPHRTPVFSEVGCTMPGLLKNRHELPSQMRKTSISTARTGFTTISAIFSMKNAVYQGGRQGAVGPWFEALLSSVVFHL